FVHVGRPTNPCRCRSQDFPDLRNDRRRSILQLQNTVRLEIVNTGPADISAPKRMIRRSHKVAQVRLILAIPQGDWINLCSNSPDGSAMSVGGSSDSTEAGLRGCCSAPLCFGSSRCWTGPALEWGRTARS